MRRPSLALTVSMIVNLLLSIWLVANYFYDVWFQNYVNTTLSQVNLFLLGGMIAIGASGVGYFYLRRRDRPYSMGKLQRSRLPKPGTGSPSRTPPQLEARGFPASSRTVSEARHTAYAVPTLAKAPPQTAPASDSFRGSSSATIAPVPKQTASFPERVPGQSIGLSESRIRPPQDSSTRFQDQRTIPARPAIVQPEPQPLNKVRPSTSPGPSTGRTPSWGPAKPPYSQPAQEHSLEKAAPYTITGVESSTRPRPLPAGQGVGSSPQPSTLFGPRWKPPDQVGKQSQWVDPVPKQPFSTPQKWSPPVGPGSTPSRNPPPQRAGQGLPQPFGQQRAPPRPLAYPGTFGTRDPRPSDPRVARPSEATPVPASAKYPGTLPGPSQSPSIQARTVIESDKVPAITPPEHTAGVGRVESASPSIAEVKKEPYAASGVGEMDWDTALDTILKTLRKDKIAEKE